MISRARESALFQSMFLSSTSLVLAVVRPVPSCQSPATDVRTPWVQPHAYQPNALRELATALGSMPLGSASLVKAYDPRNEADAFVVPTPLVKWVCGRGLASMYDPATTLRDAAAMSGAPLSAKLASNARGSFASDELATWLTTLEESTGRRVLDADVYLTSAAEHASTSASLGFHIDDIDVFLVMLSGRKRFRVAGRTLGSAVAIDHMMTPGDAIYVPALTFHSGGSAGEPSEESLMLSVAFEWPQPAAREAASGVVGRWKQTRQALLDALPAKAAARSWAWAATSAGDAALREAFAPGSSRADLLEPFLSRSS